jgi:hypothetical protein
MFCFSLFSGLAEEKPDFTYHVIETLLPNAAYKEDAGRGKLLELYVGMLLYPISLFSYLVSVPTYSIFTSPHVPTFKFIHGVATTHFPLRTQSLL